MKIKILTSIAGVNFSLSAGDVTDRFQNKEARRLIEAGLAEEFVDLPGVADHEALKADGLTLSGRVDDLEKVVSSLSEEFAAFRLSSEAEISALKDIVKGLSDGVADAGSRLSAVESAASAGSAGSGKKGGG